MEIKGIEEHCFKCKYDCEMTIKNDSKPQLNEFGELVKTTTTQIIVFRDELQKTFDFMIRRLELNENSGLVKDVRGFSRTNLQFKILDRNDKRVTYEVILKDAWNIKEWITIISTPTAYKILARAFRETLDITVWQDKIQ